MPSSECILARIGYLIPIPSYIIIEILTKNKYTEYHTLSWR